MRIRMTAETSGDLCGKMGWGNGGMKKRVRVQKASVESQCGRAALSAARALPNRSGLSSRDSLPSKVILNPAAALYRLLAQHRQSPRLDYPVPRPSLPVVPRLLRMPPRRKRQHEVPAVECTYGSYIDRNCGQFCPRCLVRAQVQSRRRHVARNPSKSASGKRSGAYGS